jgi:hypothetical protein
MSGVDAMSDQAELMNWVHRQNIERYLRLMKTELTSVERNFIEQRIAEEQAALRLTAGIAGSSRPAMEQARRP